MQFTIDGKPYGKPATEFPFRVTWDTTKLENGKHNISAAATDKAGNERKLNTVNIEVAN